MAGEFPICKYRIYSGAVLTEAWAGVDRQADAL